MDHQIAADRKEEERRQLPDQVVEEFHEEFLAVDPVPDREKLGQTVADLRQPVTAPAIHQQGACARRRFTHFGRKTAHLLYPLLVELVDLRLKMRDQPGLQGDERDRGEPEPEALQKEKPEDGDHLPRLHERLGNCIAHHAAHGFGFRRYHGYEFAL